VAVHAPSSVRAGRLSSGQSAVGCRTHRLMPRVGPHPTALSRPVVHQARATTSWSLVCPSPVGPSVVSSRDRSRAPEPRRHQVLLQATATNPTTGVPALAGQRSAEQASRGRSLNATEPVQPTEPSAPRHSSHPPDTIQDQHRETTTSGRHLAKRRSSRP